ncbi:MAG: sigma-54-dependent Fis family transcriptional regulator [Acidobacteria bacterium]|nr:sigma-54-dependent Fis family transcriptional regulator [Acidobacteriota bacterium]
MTAGVSLDRFLATAPSLSKSLQGLRRAAASEAPVLILGPPGSGRSTLARALHEASPRRFGALVEVDPGVVPSQLFESDLFGHEAGAFTGADGASPGRIGRAAGGTLLLDHVEELPLAVQAKLLRLVAERRYAPLGGREREADVRFLAIAGADLSERVAAAAFRADLFYRLEVLAFRLPPLAERRADLPALFDALLEDLGTRFERPGLELTPAARSWMLDHPWPGNLRQVRNLLERQLILGDGAILDPQPPRDGERPVPLLELERRQILRALAYTRGHQGRAAELLGISRKALWEKRRRHGLP